MVPFDSLPLPEPLNSTLPLGAIVIGVVVVIAIVIVVVLLARRRGSVG